MEEELSRGMGILDVADEGHQGNSGSHDHDDARQALENCNLIVNYLPHHIDDLSLKGLFVEFGEIVSAKVVTDRNTKKSLGYGFVKFLCEDGAKQAIQRLNGFTIDNKCLKVSVARPASLEIRNCKLYVTNLPKDYTETEVIHLFQEFGDIIECRVLKDRNSRTNKGVAFVQFDNKTQANNALSLNGCQLEGGQRGLVVKYAEDQHKKREMDRLQNLTTHNVYRYLPHAPGGSSGSGEDMGMGMGGMGGGFRAQDPSESMSPGSGYYYSSSSMSGSGSGSSKGMSPHYPSAAMHAQQQAHMSHQNLHAHQQHPHQHPHSHQLHLHSPVQPPPPHPSPVQQHHQPQLQQGQGQSHQQGHTHQGLGGINSIFGGASPLQMSLPMQASAGMVPVSPIMGAVSPHHFYHQQQQLLQQQMGANMANSSSPRMFVYSPTAGMRRAIKGRGMGAGGDPGGGAGFGAPGGGGGGGKQYPSVDISVLTSDQPASSPLAGSHHQQQQQQAQQQQAQQQALQQAQQQAHHQQQAQQYHYQHHQQHPPQHPQQGAYGGGYYDPTGHQLAGGPLVGGGGGGGGQQPQGRAVAGTADFGAMNPNNNNQQARQYQNSMPRSPVMQHSVPMHVPPGMMQPQQQQQLRNYPQQGQQAQQLLQLGMHQPQHSQHQQQQHYPQSPPQVSASLSPTHQQLQHQQHPPPPSHAQDPGQPQRFSEPVPKAGPTNSSGSLNGSNISSNGHNDSGSGDGSGIAGVTLLVSNLPAHADVAMLHDMFAPFRLLRAQIDDIDIDSTTNNANITATNTTTNTNTNTNNTISSSDSTGSSLGRAAKVQVAGMHQAESAVQAVHNCYFGSDVPVQVSIASSNFE